MFSAIRLTKINLYKHIGSVNFWTPFILALAAVYEEAHPLGELGAKYSIPVNGFSAAFILTSEYTVFILFLGIFIMFCDLPFKDNQQMFLLSRSGKRTWIFSQVLYVIFVSFAYMAFIFVCFCAFMLPNLAFDAGNWGKIIKSAAATNIGSEVGLRFTVMPSVLNDFTPLGGFLFAFGTAFAVAVILGLIMLGLNMIVKRNSGIIVSAGLIFFFMFTNYLGGALIYYFSPLSWCSLKSADKQGITAFPDVSWIIAVLCIAFAVEIAALYIFGSKRIKFVLDTKEEIT